MMADSSSQVTLPPQGHLPIGTSRKPLMSLLCPSDQVLRDALRTIDQNTHSTELLGHLSTCQYCQDRITEWGQQADLDSLMHRAGDNGIEVRTPAPDECEAKHLSTVKSGKPEGVTSNYDEPVLRRVNNYDLVELIGTGGSGNVYKARHIHLERYVAIKLLLEQYSGSQIARLRFFREMKSIGQLDHPYIVHAYDAGECDKTLYLVMELVIGENVDSFSRRVGPMPIPDACEIIRQAALGLQHIHENGLVHRDLKPSNLLISRSGIKIADLGLALLTDDDSGDHRLTGQRTVLGTADYMAPEQAEGSHKVDIRADLYSLGCTLFRLLVGQPPYGGPECDTPIKKMLAHASRPFPDLHMLRPDVPLQLVTIVNKLTAKNRKDRYDAPIELASALDPFCGDINLRKLGITAPVQPVLKNRSATIAVPSEAGGANSRTKTLSQSSSTFQRPTNRSKWIIGLLVTALVVQAAWMIGQRWFQVAPQDPTAGKAATPPPKPAPDPEPQDEPPKPQPSRTVLEHEWKNVFGQFPQVLDFPGRRNSGADHHFSDRLGMLTVQSNNTPYLIQLGTLEEGDDHFISITVPKMPKQGVFGIFAGFDSSKLSAREITWFYQFCILLPIRTDGSHLIHWTRAGIYPVEGSTITTEPSHANVMLDNSEESFTLELRLKPDEASSITMNKSTCLFNRQRPKGESYLGAYGLIIRDGEFSFLNPQLTRGNR